MSITTRINGVPGVLEVIGSAPKSARAELKRTFVAIGFGLQAHIQLQKLEGQVLHHRTGTLSSKIYPAEPVDAGGAISVTVGTNLVYGRAWELGFDRKVGAGARGGPKTLHGRARLRYFAKHPPGRKHYAARPFLRPSLTEYFPTAVKMVEKTVAKIAAASQEKLS